MAGNTKLVGFIEGNKVQLQRWGGKVTVPLDAESHAALRRACYDELPKNPKQWNAGLRNDFEAKYNEDYGRVGVDLSVETAAYLADMLEILVKDNLDAVEKVKPWAASLREAIQAHKDFHDKDEPGVES